MLLIVALCIPLFLNADSFRTHIESTPTTSLGRKVTLGKLDLSVLTGSLVAQNETIADDPAFSNEPFLQANAVKIKIALKPLIFDHEVQIKGFKIDSPHIILLRAPNGIWNYSSIGSAKKTHPSSNTPSNITVAQIEVTNGQLTVGDLPAPGAPTIPRRSYDQLKIEVDDFSSVKPFPFKLSAQIPGGGSLAADGNAGPINQADAAATPINAHVTLNHIDLATSGIVAPGTGISGIANVDIRALSDGHTLNANVSANIQSLRIAANGSPSPKPVNVQLSIAQNLLSLTGQLQKAVITIGRAVVDVSGTYQTSGPTTAINLKVSGQSIPIDELEAFLPSVGVHLPSGSRLQGGTLTTSLNVTGSTAAPLINGQLRLENTNLAGFDLGSKLSAVTALTGAKTGSATAIRSLSTNLNINGGNVRTDNLAPLDVPALGTATGAGTVSASGALNYNLILKLTGIMGTAGSVAGGAGGGIAGQLMGMIPAGKAGAVGGIAGAALRNGIPVAIGGTTSNPTFTPNLSGAMTSGASGLLSNGTQTRSPSKNSTDQLTNALGGLFGGKK